ncbi:MAG: hypothetical protein M0P11_03325 [Anaerolineaceae bacterium]|jgi:hypothetical protein|nr:hypothetical protein [Anaerolineaceae bacterium]
MTWLAVNTPSSSTDLDALLALNPDAGKTLTDFLAIAAQVNDHAMLELCRLRMAQLFNCRAALATTDKALLARLENWHKAADFSEAERAAMPDPVMRTNGWIPYPAGMKGFTPAATAVAVGPACRGARRQSA